MITDLYTGPTVYIEQNMAYRKSHIGFKAGTNLFQP